MKKHEKILAVNNQEDEDFEGYTLYPENATDESELNKRIKKHTSNSTITGSAIDKSHKFTNVSPLSIVGSND